jgi:hypothetical protein
MRLAGLEPAAHSLGNCCSIHLSYRRMISSYQRLNGIAEYHGITCRVHTVSLTWQSNGIPALIRAGGE